MGLLVRKGKTYQSNMVLYDEHWRKTVYDKAVELLYSKLEKVKKLVIREWNTWQRRIIAMRRQTSIQKSGLYYC